MNNLIGFIQNKYIYIPVLLWFGIQLFKLIYDLVTTKKFNFKRIMGAGGMPSSHSAFVCSLATTIGITEGVSSPLFAMAVALSAIVMYDAAGVRRAAGKQAKILNQIIESEGENINVQEKLIELLGHTPLEVYVGALVGIVMAFLFVPIWR